MKKLLVLTTILALHFTANAQLGGALGKIKNKAQSAATSEKSSSSNTSTGTTTKAPTAANADKIPAAKDRTDKDWFYKTSLDAGTLKSDNTFYDFTKVTDSSRITYNQYEPRKAAYMKKGENDQFVLKYIGEVDEFYTIYVPRLKSYLFGKSDEAIKWALPFSKAARAAPDYKKKFNPGQDMNILAKNLGDLNPLMEKALLFAPGDAEILEKMNKMKELKADLEQYESSGEHAKDMEGSKKAGKDAILCPKAANTDPNLIAVVKKGFDAERDGTLTRISILSTDWLVRKNDLSIPVCKVIRVFIVHTKDGKCYLGDGTLRCDYEGGGVYGKPFYNNLTSEEMNCENAQK